MSVEGKVLMGNGTDPPRLPPGLRGRPGWAGPLFVDEAKVEEFVREQAAEQGLNPVELWRLMTAPPVTACEGRRWRRAAERQGCGDHVGVALLMAWILGSFLAFLW